MLQNKKLPTANRRLFRFNLMISGEIIFFCHLAILPFFSHHVTNSPRPEWGGAGGGAVTRHEIPPPSWGRGSGGGVRESGGGVIYFRQSAPSPLSNPIYNWKDNSTLHYPD
jgi:hypothetical protein